MVTRKLYWILVLIACVFLSRTNVGAQDFFTEQYKAAFELAEMDSALIREFCNGKSMRLEVHPHFNYFPTTRFGRLLDTTLSQKEYLKVQKLDRRQEKFSRRPSYAQMTQELYSVFRHCELPCAIICFDRMKNNLLLAEVTYYQKAIDWWVITGDKPSFYILFDFRETPPKYYKLRVVR